MEYKLPVWITAEFLPLTIQVKRELAERERLENEKLKAENEALKVRLDRLEKLILSSLK